MRMNDNTLCYLTTLQLAIGLLRRILGWVLLGGREISPATHLVDGYPKEGQRVAELSQSAVTDLTPRKEGLHQNDDDGSSSSSSSSSSSKEQQQQ
eukprot:COSAG02_NODE_4206_length_5626_cov_10.092619_9_plen_95_part_00